MRQLDSLKSLIETQSFETKNIEKLTQFREISKDTRSLQEGDIYIALKGENFDGHDFIESIKEKAVAVICEQPQSIDICQIIVPDALAFLQEWAYAYRMVHRAEFICVTGTNGKTSSKEMIYQLLKTQYRTYRTAGNYNNHIGVPLTLLNMPDNCQVAVIEIGTNHPGEIKQLATWVNADSAIVTNVAYGHMAHFEQIEDLVNEKCDCFRYAKANARIYINADDPYLAGFQEKNHRIYYSVKNKTEHQVTFLTYHENGTMEFKYRNENYMMPAYGKHFLYSAALSLAVADSYQIASENIKESFANYHSLPGRMEWILKGNYRFIHDAYNANPNSMKAAIEFVKEFRCSEAKILILGDMLELGKEEDSLHQEMIDSIDLSSFTDIFLYGPRMGKVKHPHVKQFNSYKDLSETIQQLYPQALILLKGSRGMTLEKILRFF